MDSKVEKLIDRIGELTKRVGQSSNGCCTTWYVRKESGDYELHYRSACFAKLRRKDKSYDNCISLGYCPDADTKVPVSEQKLWAKILFCHPSIADIVYIDTGMKDYIAVQADGIELEYLLHLLCTHRPIREHHRAVSHALEHHRDGMTNLELACFMFFAKMIGDNGDILPGMCGHGNGHAPMDFICITIHHLVFYALGIRPCRVKRLLRKGATFNHISGAVPTLATSDFTEVFPLPSGITGNKNPLIEVVSRVLEKNQKDMKKEFLTNFTQSVYEGVVKMGYSTDVMVRLNELNWVENEQGDYHVESNTRRG